MVAEPMDDIQWRQEYRNQTSFDKKPWLSFEPDQIISIYESLRTGLQDLGLIRSNPTEEEIKSLQNQLADAVKVRDKLVAVIEKIHSNIAEQHD
jgi:hypothetical protein